VRKVRKVLGWEARIWFRDGIADTVSWLRSVTPVPTT
jgi:nucleoside-diphosphate-sugar epimerase